MMPGSYRSPRPTEDEIDEAIEAAESRHGEAARVVQMTVARLIELGVDPDTAATYAPQVDWHDVERLVLRGCSPEVALEIVR